MKALIVVLALFAVAIAEQSVPIPTTADGFLVGNTSATFQVDAFLDLLCTDCLSDWPTLKQVASDASKYGV